MPQFRGLTVHVTDRYGNNLPEWGVHHLRQTNRISAYVQSTTDAAFRVSVQPNIPYVDPDHTPYKDKGQEYNHGHLPSSFPLGGYEKATVPPYSFLAALYLDGRTTPEREIIVYTDPNDSDFDDPHGKVWFKHRSTQTTDGRIAEYGWVFKDKAIERVFNMLNVSGPVIEPREQSNDEDALIGAMQSSGLDVPETVQDVRSKVGQILVEISRITLGTRYNEDNYLPEVQERKDDDINMDDVTGEITHGTAIVRKAVIQPMQMQMTEISPYREDEGVFARFQFFYRSQEQLQKFGFPGFPMTSKVSVKNWRQRNAQMAALTPLSISQVVGSKPKIPTGGAKESYEEKVKKRSFKKDESFKYDFGVKYRDVLEGASAPVASLLGFGGHSAPATGENSTSRKGSGFAINENSEKYPAAPLPLMDALLEAKKKGSASAVEGNSGKHAEASLPFVKEQKQLIRYLAFGDNPSDTSLSGPSLQSGDNDLGFKLGTFAATGVGNPFHSNLNNRFRLVYTGEIFKPKSTEETIANTPDSTAVEPPSSPTPSTSLSIGNLAKLNTHLGSKGPGNFMDSDDDADESTAESDVEPHKGDDDFSYAANPEEDDEVYQGMRSHFKGFGFKKRTHVEIETAKEDEAQGSSGLADAEGSGNVSQSAGLAPLDPIEDKKDTPRAKKVKFSDPELLFHMT
ncbi:hypothetical protein N7G274_003525 [Stereocaulon virgatum]|uniref:DUF7918 domain-containing protein n=1 Tax=Stereocaulon virgatum TaxID=373712 RepID=A0ABR4AEV5_9LECA